MNQEQCKKMADEVRKTIAFYISEGIEKNKISQGGDEMSLNQTAAAVVCALRANRVNPEISLDAAAGSDFGHVSMWPCDDRGGYVVEWGDNAETSYDITDDTSDPIGWMIPDDLSGDPATIANYRGADEVCEYNGNGDDGCRVLITRSYYGPTEHSDYARDDRGDEIVFGNREAAQSWIDETDDETYITSHNESGRPEYKIVAA